MSQKLVEDNIGLVYYLINRYYPTFITDEDVIQCGMMGLCQAALKYDESKGITFASFASKCILYEVIREFKRRKRHHGVLSLETKVTNDNGDARTISDTVIGEEDVDFVDFESFYNQLTPLKKQMVDYKRMGLTCEEIGQRLGCSAQNVNKTLRGCRFLWRKLYES